MNGADLGYDEWLTLFRRACELHGCEYLASKETGAERDLERLWEAGKSPDEAIEVLQFGG